MNCVYVCARMRACVCVCLQHFAVRDPRMLASVGVAHPPLTVFRKEPSSLLPRVSGSLTAIMF